MKLFDFLSLLRIVLFPILYAFSLIYSVLFRFDRRFTKKKKLPGAFVISVGNISMGGTGKTPFSIYLAKLIHKKFPEKKSFFYPEVTARRDPNTDIGFQNDPLRGKPETNLFF